MQSHYTGSVDFSAYTHRKCHCGKGFFAKIADVERGWAKSCSKRCAAIARERAKRDKRSNKKLLPNELLFKERHP